jgi:geranylgeranyl pyrophosphate synthase
MLSEMMDSGEMSSGMKQAERCRPDYEAQIKNLNDKLLKNQALFSALMDYIGGKRVRDKLAEMIGELVSEEHQLMKSIEQTIVAQEADPENNTQRRWIT